MCWSLFAVMSGVAPGIHVLELIAAKDWMAGQAGHDKII
jgi:hypothetical protein